MQRLATTKYDSFTFSDDIRPCKLPLPQPTLLRCGLVSRAINCVVWSTPLKIIPRGRGAPHHIRIGTPSPLFTSLRVYLRSRRRRNCVCWYSGPLLANSFGPQSRLRFLLSLSPSSLAADDDAFVRRFFRKDLFLYFKGWISRAGGSRAWDY